jgi:hypothetical protein
MGNFFLHIKRAGFAWNPTLMQGNHFIYYVRLLQVLFCGKHLICFIKCLCLFRDNRSLIQANHPLFLISFFDKTYNDRLLVFDKHLIFKLNLNFGVLDLGFHTTCALQPSPYRNVFSIWVIE